MDRNDRADLVQQWVYDNIDTPSDDWDYETGEEESRNHLAQQADDFFGGFFYQPRKAPISVDSISASRGKAVENELGPPDVREEILSSFKEALASLPPDGLEREEAIKDALSAAALEMAKIFIGEADHFIHNTDREEVDLEVDRFALLDLVDSLFPEEAP